MTKQKQSRTDLLENKMKALIGVVQQIITENTRLKEIAVGTLQLVKKLPDYDKALEDLTADLKKEEEEHAKEIKKPEERKLEL